MFEDKINRTPFSELYTEGLSKLTTAMHFNGDMSFASTLEALLFNRAGIEQEINLQVRNLPFEIERKSAECAAFGDYIRRTVAKNSIFVLPLRTPKDTFESLMEDVVALFPDAIILNNVNSYFANVGQVFCFRIRVGDAKSTCIFVNGLEYKLYHAIQCAIPFYLPEIFTKDCPLNDKEIRLLNSLKGNSPYEYLKCIEDIYATTGFRENEIKRDLTGYEKNRYENLLTTYSNNLSEYQRQVNSAMETLRTFAQRRDEARYKVIGIRHCMENLDNESEIEKYFLQNKNIDLVSVIGNSIRFVCKGYVTMYDSEVAKIEISNPNSYIYHQNYGSGTKLLITTADMHRLLNAIFVDRKLKLRFCAAYEIDDEYVNAKSEFKYIGCSTYTPNPHIDQYSCIGDFDHEIAEALANGNIIQAFELTFASCGALNFSDSCVMQEFIRRIYTGKNGYGGTVNLNCIELPDHTIVTTTEAAAWLKECEIAEKFREECADEELL